MNRLVLLPLASAFVLLSCTDDMLTPLPVEPDPAVSCPLSGAILRLGSDDALAAAEERPGWTRFRHDFRMDRTEMTQVDFVSLLGRNPSTFRGDSLPVTDVSWYDAVLAANARSRRDGLDTIYEYAAVSSDAQGNATNLDGLTIHLDRSGWRLPTEAEWEAAARAGTSTPWTWGSLSDSGKAGAYAWYHGNAGGRMHPVATKSPNAWGLYDMAGNAMEWVNDWKGSFPTDTVEEFAGQENPGDVAEVPLKGGSYNYSLSQLRPSGRTATYAAYRSSRAEYVGFRLCRGGFTARYANSSGVVVQAPPVTLVRTDVPRLTGSWEARLVFVNRANGKGVLTWIDYGEPNPVARSLPDKDPVFHPVISPDGRWVAWSTALEGSTGASRIKARRLAKNDTAVLDLGEGAIPRWWVSGADTFLIAGDARDDLSSGWSGTKTIAWRWSNGVLASPSTWSSEGSYHDGRSGPYLYTGYRRLRQYDTRSGTSRILFTAPLNGKASGDTSQVCNVSAAPDSSGRSLFLDFGYTGTSSIVKRPYGIHEIAFVSDSTGRVEKTIPSPSGEAQWEHLEWSNSSKWAVSGAIDSKGAYRNLYLVDLENATSTRIVSGEQIWQPGLWLGKGATIESLEVDLDSACRYYEPIRSPEMDFFGDNLLRFWIRKDSADVLMVGSSHIAGMPPATLANHVMVNLGMPASTYSDWDRALRDIGVPHMPKLKVVVMTLMPGWFFPSGGNWPGARWETSVAPTTGVTYDANHGFWASGLPSGYVDNARKIAEARGVPLMIGMTDDVGAGWGIADLHPPVDEDTTSAEFRANYRLLLDMADYLARRGVHLLLVNFPQNPGYRQTRWAGRYGPTWDMYGSILGRVRELARENRYVHFYDAYNGGENDYVDADANNSDHLSPLGLHKLGGRIDSVISGILK